MAARMHRRRFLLGAGGAVLGLPFLQKFPGSMAKAQTTGPRRVVVLAYPMGTVVARAQPAGDGFGFTLPYVTEPLAPFQDRTIFVSQIDNAAMRLNRQHSFGHPAKKESALTGSLMRGCYGGDKENHVDRVLLDAGGATDGGPNGPSVCHFIGEHLRTGAQPMRSIDLAVNGRHERAHNEVPSAFFFEGPANPVSVQANPARAFHASFDGIGAGGGEDPAVAARRHRTASVLDAVRASFRDLRQGLGAEDRRRLDDHADRIRQLERDMQPMACSPPTGFDGAGAGASYEPFLGRPMRALADLQRRILVSSMACDLAPVGRMEFIEQQRPYFGLPSVDEAHDAWLARSKDWHAMVHGDASPIDGSPTRDASNDRYASFLLDGYRFFVQQFADLLSDLDSIPEGPDGSSMLDHTLCVLATDFGDGGGHAPWKMLWTLAGNTGSAPGGQHFRVPASTSRWSDYNTNHLLTSIIRMCGVTKGDGSPVEEFGVRGFATGTLPLFG